MDMLLSRNLYQLYHSSHCVFTTFGESSYCLVLLAIARQLYCTTADFLQLTAILAVSCLVKDSCVDISTSNLFRL